MSRDTAMAFRRSLEHQPEIASAVRERAGDVDAIVELAAEHGFECTADELVRAFEDLAAAELERVAGGRRAYHRTFTGGVFVSAGD